MAITIGNSSVRDIYLGNSKVDSVFLGDVLVYGNLANDPEDTYNKFVFDVFDREMQHRNRLILSANKNLMFFIRLFNRYFIATIFNFFSCTFI